jgi:peptidoglycan/LPS O-acetylase OafA/YrhL
MTTLLESPTVTSTPPPTVVPAAPRRFRPDVEGLRAVAVGLVVLFHAGITWLPGGYVGVDVFFVISGFLITGLLLREFETNGKIGLTNFYARRARRILPLASVVLIVTVGASSILLTTIRMASIPIDGVWTSVFAANFRFANSGANYLNATAPPSPLQHFWSLAVEEQFYVVWPALLWCVLHFSRRSGGRARVAVISSLAVAASLFWCIHQTAYDANTAYFSPFTRGWELGIGALVAVCGPWLMRLPRLAAAALGWCGLGLIIYGAVRFDSRTAFPGSAALVPVLGAACVITGGLLLARGGPERVLGLKPMQLIGKYSFSLYLWHWPILIIAEGHFQHLNVIEKLGLVLLAGLLSAVTFYRLENAVRRMPRLVRSPWASLTVGLVAISASLIYSGIYVTGNRYVEARVQAQADQQLKASSATTSDATSAEIIAAVRLAAQVDTLPADVSPPVAIAARDISPAYKDGCMVDTGPVTSPACEFGDSSAARTVVLLGDSHAAQWLPALTALAKQTPFKVVVLTKHSCPVASVATYDGIVKRAYNECGTWRNWAFQRIAQLKPDLIIATETLQAQVNAQGRQINSNERIWQAGLGNSLRILQRSAKKVVFLSDTPYHAVASPTCLQQNQRDIARCADTPQKSLNQAHQRLDAMTVRKAGAQYLDIDPLFCTLTSCPAVVGNKITTFDGNHMTTTYASYVSHAFGVSTGIVAAPIATDAAAVVGAVRDAADNRGKYVTLTPPLSLAPKDLSPAYTNGCLVDAPKTTSPACTYPGPTADSKRVVLFGDSHAAQWVPALQDSASRTNFSLTVLTKGNCPAPTMTAYSVLYHRAFTECDTWRKWALAEVAKLKPSVVIMSSTFHGVALAHGAAQTPAVEAAWEAGLRSTIRALQATGARVVDVSDIANHAESVPECLLEHALSPSSCATPAVLATLGPHQATETATVKRLGATYVDARPWFCTATICPAVVNGIITDFDDSHMTATYSTYLGRAFGVAVGLERP